MTEDRIESLLYDGIAAARDSDHEKARELLRNVIEADEQNERAWLWMSAVVETAEDKRICLENVLALNPDSTPARRGLERLELLPGRDGEASTDQIIRREHEPISLAGAVLYPERQVTEWRWQDSTPVHQAHVAAYQDHSRYDDVWERDSEICAYCAYEIDDEIDRCPKCRRRLNRSQFRYARASPDLTVYWVLLLGLGQLFFLQLLLDLVTGKPLMETAWNGLLFAVMVILTAGIIMRRFWFYIASLGLLLMIVSAMLLETLAGVFFDDVASRLVDANLWQALAADPYFVLLSPLARFLRPLQMLAALLALLYGLLRVGPDFERITVREVARLDQVLNDASEYYAKGQDYASKDMWANAVLHWRRATANDPGRAFYQVALGKGYARLGYYERSLDVLRSARALIAGAKAQSEVDGLIADVRLKQVTESWQARQQPHQAEM